CLDRLSILMLPITLVLSDRTVRTYDYVAGYQSRSSLFSLRWLVPSAQSLAKIIRMRSPSVARSVTPVCDGFAFFRFKCSTPAIGHVSEARELRSSRQQNDWKAKA